MFAGIPDVAVLLVLLLDYVYATALRKSKPVFFSLSFRGSLGGGEGGCAGGGGRLDDGVKVI